MYTFYHLLEYLMENIPTCVCLLWRNVAIDRETLLYTNLYELRCMTDFIVQPFDPNVEGHEVAISTGANKIHIFLVVFTTPYNQV